MKNLSLEKKISNSLQTLQKQSRSLLRLFNDGAALYSLLQHTAKLKKSLKRLDHLLVERFIKSNLYRYKYPGDRAKFIQDIVRLHRYCS